MKLEKVNKNIYVGIAFIAVGTLLLLNQLGIISWEFRLKEIIFSWQMLLIVIGIWLRNKGKSNAAVVLIAVGVFFLLPKLFTLPYYWKTYVLPVILISLGLFILFKYWRKSYKQKALGEGVKKKNDVLDYIVFSGKKSIIETDDFRGGDSTVLFGGAEYNLVNSKIGEDEVIFDCFCVAGGITLKIPLNWEVRNESTMLFGGLIDERDSLPDSGFESAKKVLVIRGFCICGAIEIKY